ncbi:lef-2 [Psilogramma increta granulovirus]|uniref:Lef-2 n=1 Tax=Psilogramma increta granulovirus TaxID=2953508 RepID=A0A977XVJ0_9BBAC|nr:lef-2 [Psilogramma increta granulovirus]
METFNPRLPIDETKTYKVDKFLMQFNEIGGQHTFLPGGRYFVLYGKQLQLLLKKSASFEEDNDTNANYVKSRKKKNVCFLSTMTSRNTLIAHYKEIFFTHKKSTKSFEAFNNLCIRVRNQRYNNRLTFNYLVIKQLQCDRCLNKCVHEALKRFYNMDNKCVNQIDRLIAQEYNERDI